jgi:ABC-2 type transport system permease protein
MSAWRAELLKVSTVKGQWIGLVLATVAMPLVSMLVVATGHLGAGATVTSAAASGSVLGLLAFGAWGALSAASEYTSGTIVVSLATVPRRSVLFSAKLAAASTVAGVGALVSSLIALVGVLAVMPSGHHPLGDPADLFGVVLVTMAVTGIGSAIGMISRSPSASIVIVAGAVLLPNAASGLLGRIEPWVVGTSPGTVIAQIAGNGPLSPSQVYPAGTWAAAATLLLVAAAISAAGAVVLSRRDG